MLNTIRHASEGSARPLVIAHGLYGSGRNWGAVARAVSDRGPVLAVDHRNHGQSPWHETHTYDDLAEDLAEVIEHDVQAPVDLLGHSMGGKAGMVLALKRPDLVARLIVADIAPVRYTHNQTGYIDLMRSVDLTQVTRRAEVEAQLRARLEDPMLASFFSQSVDLTTRTWRLNLDVLEQFMPEILGFPEMHGPFENRTLFLSGAASDYVQRTHRETIKDLFPRAGFLKIPGAGHWLHAEKPKEFVAALRAWLG